VLLKEHGYDFDELELLRNYPHRALRALSGGDTYPQVFINGELIGGADDLTTWLQEKAAA
jgi:glutaredoxin-related protein